MALAMFGLPLANAHTPAWTMPSWAYIIPAPNPVGVGQQALQSRLLPVVPHSKSVSSPDNPHQADEDAGDAQRYDEDDDVLEQIIPFRPVQGKQQDEDEPHKEADH